MKKSELFTQEMLEKFKCHPNAVAHSQYCIRGYVVWFTKTDVEAEYKYPDRVTCND